ncbi:unnamed protein product [Clavelina lepadiformis]|uniref:Fibrinogen C-terminal domain-containing protein n=1 Tax=Clavelina lepadiformis TaxID=159417 RepID=A0ABP0G970_CLALP
MLLLKGISLEHSWFYYNLLLLPFHFWYCQAIDGQAGNILQRANRVNENLKKSYLTNGDFHQIKNCLSQHQIVKKLVGFKTNLNHFDHLYGKLYKECTSIYASGSTSSGIYPIWLKERFQFTYVYCDMELVSTKKGWTTIQRRMNGEINFERGWDDYVRGFGNPSSEYWLGLENMYRLSRQITTATVLGMIDIQSPAIGFDLEDWDGMNVFVQYTYFWLESKATNYLLNVRGLSRTFWNYFDTAPIYESEFSTPDKDNDDDNNAHCARDRKSGWWFHSCFEANLNGAYPKYKQKMKWENILWRGWQYINNNGTALRFVSMKLYHTVVEP